MPQKSDKAPPEPGQTRRGASRKARQAPQLTDEQLQAIASAELPSTGRPTDLTPKLAKDICAAIKNGAPFETAARAFGVAPGTFHRWRQPCPIDLRESPEHRHNASCMHLVEVAPGLFREFGELVDRADAEGEAELALLLKAQAPKDARSATYLLEQRYRDRWRRDAETQIIIPPGGIVPAPVVFNMIVSDRILTKEQRLALELPKRVSEVVNVPAGVTPIDELGDWEGDDDEEDDE